MEFQKLLSEVCCCSSSPSVCRWWWRAASKERVWYKERCRGKDQIKTLFNILRHQYKKECYPHIISRAIHTDIQLASLAFEIKIDTSIFGTDTTTKNFIISNVLHSRRTCLPSSPFTNYIFRPIAGSDISEFNISKCMLLSNMRDTDVPRWTRRTNPW